MNSIIFIFCIIVVLFTVISIIVVLISTYPPQFIVKNSNKNSLYELNKYYFYYQKATAYRMLFSGFSIFDSAMQILSVASTFITIYIAIKDSNYVILAALISATCQVINLLLQPTKYIKAFSDSALIMEFALNKHGLTEEQAYEEFLNAYKEAERVITETK